MSISKPGKTLFASALALAAASLPIAPAMAAEVAPLDDAALGQITAQGMAELSLLIWLPDPGSRIGILPAENVGTDRPSDSGGLIVNVLQSDRSTMSLARQDARGIVSGISQTATIDLPRAAGSQTVGMIAQSGGDVFGGGQSATNLAVVATLNGVAFFGSIRP